MKRLIIIIFIIVLPMVSSANFTTSVYPDYEYIQRKQTIKNICKIRKFFNILLENPYGLSHNLISDLKEFSEDSKNLCECVETNYNINRCISTEELIELMDNTVYLFDEYKRETR